MPLEMYKEPVGPTKPKIKHVVAVAAGKGGVGKSTVAVNLALACQRRGLLVGVLDMDIYGPSMRVMLPEEHPPSQKGDFLYPAQCFGKIQMVSMAYFRDVRQAAAVRAPIANSIVKQFVENVVWRDLDILIVDFPPGTGDIQLTTCQSLAFTGALLVTTPQLVSMNDVQKAIHLFGQMRIPLLGVVENMSYYLCESTGERKYLFGKGGGQTLADGNGLSLLGQIPIEANVSLCCDSGKSLFEEYPKSTAAQVFEEITGQLLQKIDGEGAKEEINLVWKEMES